MKNGMCPNTSRQPPTHTQCIPVATSDHPSLTQFRSGHVALSQHAASMRTRGMVIQAARQVCQRLQGRTEKDRHTQFGMHKPSLLDTGLELLLFAPPSLSQVLHLLLVDFPPLSPSQGSAGLSLGQMKWIFREGRKLLCS